MNYIIDNLYYYLGYPLKKCRSCNYKSILYICELCRGGYCSTCYYDIFLKEKSICKYCQIKN